MFGLFDWIWDLLYSISKSMYAIIDKLLACANMLCGIEPIRYAGNEMDFISFLLRNQSITYAFVGAVLVAVVLVFLFAVFAIIRTIASEKVEKTPAQIAVQVGKTLLIFLFIPAAMVVLIFFTNTIMRVLYSATLGGSPDGLGRFLAGAFGQNALKGGVPSDFFLDKDFDYSSTSSIKDYVNLKDYDFFFSYLGSIVIIICLGMALIMFVDRAISIVILFIVAPISLSTTVLDDGVRFKLWRDQFIVKFLTGYGVIISINIYALVIAAITNGNLVFFDNKVLNYFMKIVIVVGGGVSMMKIMSLIGNLISAGAGSQEMRDSALAAGSFKRLAFGAVAAPFQATRSAFNFARDSKNTGLGTALGRRAGFKTSRDYALENARLNAGGQGKGGSSGATNNKTSQINNGSNAAKDAIGGEKKKFSESQKQGVFGIVPGGNNGGNKNEKAAGPGSDMVNNAVSNALNGKKGGDKK